MAPLPSNSKNRITKPKAKPSKSNKTKKAAAADRIMTDVLLAIRSIHLGNIASRCKNHEYRKYRLRDGVKRLWFYETGADGGRSSITHIAVIPASIRHEPGSVPTEPFGIGNEDFNAGRKESKYGYPILELYELVKPVSLAEMQAKWAMSGAPKGWCYVGSALWTDRWGKDDSDRDQKVKKIF
ncbi:hypothetical protein GGR50DRAFT_362219 [Xylaria sp. CBS 124048]|nr:hypothetical protein GGR50DRAFT_362219 [Xylaria sp. CBS 124048]